MAEATSALSFADLIIEFSRKLGTASYGAAGDEAVQVPSDVHDLAEAKRMVNNAIRMFINDSPKRGWRWTTPIASVALWATVAVDAANVVTFAGYDPATDKTTITVTSAVFLASMEEKTLTLTTTGDQTITDVVSTTSVKVSGELTASIDAETFSITADGNYTMPPTFGGEKAGPITFAAGSNLGVGLEWSTESVIRGWRADTAQTGDPFVAETRIKDVVIGSRRRHELMVYPTPSSAVTVEFPFVLAFDKMVEFEESPPTPISQDENVRAAVLAIADKDGEGAQGLDWQYYRDIALPRAHSRDARSAPRSVGSFNHGSSRSNAEAIRVFRSTLMQRPDVGFNS
jgi:hypothetical protein